MIVSLQSSLIYDPADSNLYDTHGAHMFSLIKKYLRTDAT